MMMTEEQKVQHEPLLCILIERPAWVCQGRRLSFELVEGRA